MKIKNINHLDARIKEGEYAWPGGYPTFFGSDSSVCCFDCMKGEGREEAEEWMNEGKELHQEINWDNPDLYCEVCNNRIESAYAEEEE